MTHLKPRMIQPIALHPTHEQRREMRAWWRHLRALDACAYVLIHAALRRAPLPSAGALIAAALQGLDAAPAPDPNALVSGHRHLRGARHRPLSKDELRAQLREVQLLLADASDALPLGLIDGLAHRWYDAVAEDRGRVVADLPRPRAAGDPLELYIQGAHAPDDVTLRLRTRGAEIDLAAEVFTLDPLLREVARSPFKTPAGRLSETVIQETAEGWRAWLSFSLDELPGSLPEPGSAIGIDPGIARWLTGWDGGLVTFAQPRAAADDSLAARRDAYVLGESAIEDAVARLLRYETVGIEGTCWSREMSLFRRHLDRTFLPTVIDRVASVARACGGREVLRTPASYSSCRCPVCGARLRGRAVLRCECGRVGDRDVIAARNHRAMLLHPPRALPRWWAYLPPELRRSGD